jgi:hypothetical protein
VSGNIVPVIAGREKLNKLATDAFESLDRDFEEADVVLGVAMLVIELKVRDESADGATSIYLHCTDSRGWIQRGLLAEACGVVEEIIPARQEDED